VFLNKIAECVPFENVFKKIVGLKTRFTNHGEGLKHIGQIHSSWALLKPLRKYEIFCGKIYQIKYNIKLIVLTQLRTFFLKQQLNKPFLHCRHKTTCQSHSTYLKHKTMLFLPAYIEYTEI
jgi:hypothetical protein